jgi:tetratricopeptide (TPR) repeat protein
MGKGASKMSRIQPVPEQKMSLKKLISGIGAFAAAALLYCSPCRAQEANERIKVILPHPFGTEIDAEENRRLEFMFGKDLEQIEFFQQGDQYFYIGQLKNKATIKGSLTRSRFDEIAAGIERTVYGPKIQSIDEQNPEIDNILMQIKANPLEQLLYLNLSKEHFKANKRKNAFEALKQGIEIDATKSGPLFEFYAESLQSADELASGAEYLENMVRGRNSISSEMRQDLVAKLSSLYFKRGELLQQRGSFRDAISAYNNSYRRGNKSAQLRFNIGICYKEMSMPTQALDYFYAARSTDRKMWQAYYECAKIYSRLNDSRAAVYQYEEVIRLNPAESIVDEYMQIISKTDDYDRRVSFLKKVYGETNSKFLFLQMAECWANIAEKTKNYAHWGTAIGFLAHVPDSPRKNLILGHWHNAMNMTEKAKEYYTRCLSSVSDPEIVAEIEEINKYELSKQLWSQLSQSQKSAQEQTDFNLAGQKYSKGDWISVMRLLEKYPDSSNDNLHRVLGDAYKFVGRFEDAKQQYSKLKNENNRKLCLARLNSYLDLYIRSITDYMTDTPQQKNSIEIWQNLFWLYQNAYNFNKQSNLIESNFSESAFELGNKYFESEQYSKALEYYNAVINPLLTGGAPSSYSSQQRFYALRARTKYNLDDLNGAYEDILRANDRIMREFYGTELAGRCGFDQAYKILTSLPKTTRVLYELGKLFQRTKFVGVSDKMEGIQGTAQDNHPKAIEYFTEAASQKFLDSFYLQFRGDSNYELAKIYNAKSEREAMSYAYNALKCNTHHQEEALAIYRELGEKLGITPARIEEDLKKLNLK